MKKVLITVIMILMVAFAFCMVANASDDNIKVNVDGKNIEFDVPPRAINGRTMVPVRAIFESLGATVNWDTNTNTAYATNGVFDVALPLNQNYILVNGHQLQMDAQAIAIDNRILAPARFVAESFGCTVLWEGSTQTAHIFSPNCTNEFYPYNSVPSLTAKTGYAADFIKADFDVNDNGDDLFYYIYYFPADYATDGTEIVAMLQEYADLFASHGWNCEYNVVSKEPSILLDVYCTKDNNMALVTVDYWEDDHVQVVVGYYGQ